MAKDKYLIVVIGPTAVGKTATCIRLAHHFQCEIVSADSRQFYQELEIGTAKPSTDELAMATHHFINSHSIKDDISAGQYEKMALAKIEELFNNQDKVILTGGSGLYINAITDGMADIPAVDPSIRKELNERLEKEGLSVLVAELKALDPDYYNKVDKENPHRIIRALEICMGTGKPFSFYRKPGRKERPFEIVKIGLTRDREELYERINQRMDIMIGQGLFEEAKRMMPYKSHNALQTVGYKEIFDYLEGAYDKEEAIRLLKRNSRRYAKRQMTWFGKDEKIHWFHPKDEDKIIEFIEEVLH